MKLTGLHLQTYRLPLNRPIPVGRTCLNNTRAGAILTLIDEHGHRAYGDIAPLPGLSAEPLTIAVDEILDRKDFLLTENIPCSFGHLPDKGFQKWVDVLKLSSSARFGLESALMSLSAQRRKVGLADVLYKTYARHIPINALLTGEPEEITDQIPELIKQGFQSFKLKVGGRPIEEDIALVQKVFDTIDGKALLRLDANRAWDLVTAIAFGEAVGPAVEYIEEPCQDPFQSSAFFDKTLIPVAFDETLREYEIGEIKSLEGVEVVIIKPTLTGGLQKSMTIVEEAHVQGLRVIISSCFESRIGLQVLAELAAGVSHGVAAGLGTGMWFQDDLYNGTPLVERGHIMISHQAHEAPALNPQWLETIL